MILELFHWGSDSHHNFPIKFGGLLREKSIHVPRGATYCHLFGEAKVAFPTTIKSQDCEKRKPNLSSPSLFLLLSSFFPHVEWRKRPLLSYLVRQHVSSKLFTMGTLAYHYFLSVSGFATIERKFSCMFVPRSFL